MGSEERENTDSVMIRVQKKQIDELRNMFPDLKDEDNTALVRIALSRFLMFNEVER